MAIDAGWRRWDVAQPSVIWQPCWLEACRFADLLAADGASENAHASHFSSLFSVFALLPATHAVLRFRAFAGDARRGALPDARGCGVLCFIFILFCIACTQIVLRALVVTPLINV